MMAETLKDIFVHHVHYVGLLFMAVVYAFKIRWILKFPAPSERTPPRGRHADGVLYSFATLVNPTLMESTARRPSRWIEFVVLHIGVTVGIAATLAMPHATSFFWQPGVAWSLRILLAAAFFVGLIRLYRRLFNKVMRPITHRDDLFAIAVIALWFVTAFFGIAPLFGPATSVDSYSQAADLWAVGILFALTSFLLFYVPFSKISHYIFWPFQRYYIGKHLGHRGVFPRVRAAS
ncbi:MAG: hypothetical protein AB1486_16285 [Planctomycetota bacterium]